MVSFERVFEVLDLPIEIEDPVHPSTPVINGEIKYVTTALHWLTW